MSNGPFRSTGTIRVRFELVKSDDPESHWTTEIFFTPNADSTVRYGDKKYAVFIRDDGGNACMTSEPLDDSSEGVSITVKPDLPGLVAAAAQQTLVEVEVNCDWKLHAITIPAPRKKK